MPQKAAGDFPIAQAARGYRCPVPSVESSRQFLNGRFVCVLADMRCEAELGRVLTGAQIAAGYARLLCGLRYGFFTYPYGHLKSHPCASLTRARLTILVADSLVQKSLVASKKFELIILFG
jgi:hypothetical protein